METTARTFFCVALFVVHCATEWMDGRFWCAQEFGKLQLPSSPSFPCPGGISGDQGPGRQWATTTTIYPQNTRIRQPGEEEWRPEYNGFAIALNNGHPNPNVSLHRLIVRWAIGECLTSHHHRHRHCTFNGDCCELEHPDDDDVDHPSIHASSQVTKPTK